tara:strand:+ start:75 stop:314 length:240 start_codon:yes stop_codon:yes gene_type:complete
MDYLKINKRFRAFLAVIGLISLSYGIYDIHRDEAGRKGLNSNREDSPVSYYITVGKKTVFGAVLIIVAISPLMGKSAKK